MAMKVKTNMAAVHSLGQLNINITELGKALAKVSSGQKINSAGDDASGLAISERMRVRIRALEQDITNVKNGRAMLDTAEGGLQRQLDLMRTIKAKVIDAANDSNTEEDRMTIQKEIDHHFQEIQSIAYDTDFNGIKLLIGNERLRDQVLDWTVVGEPEFVEDSDVMDVVANEEDELDDIEGPFAVFKKYKVDETTIDALFEGNTASLSGGTDGTPAIFEMDLDAYNSPTDLIGHGFMVSAYTADATSKPTRYYVFRDSTANPQVEYNAPESTVYIDVNPNSSDWKTQARDGIIAAVNGAQSNCITAEPDGNKIKFTSVNKHSDSNYNQISGLYRQYVPEEVHPAKKADPTGLGTHNLSGGTNAETHTESQPGYFDPATDEWVQPPDITVVDKPGKSATLKLDVSGVPDQSGFIVTGNGGTKAYVRFVDGAGSCYNDTANGIIIVPKESSNGINLGNGITLTMDGNGNMTLTANVVGTTGNSWGISQDGFNEPETTDPPKEEILPANSATLRDEGTDGEYAYKDMNLTDWDTTDADKLEEFIAKFKGEPEDSGDDTKGKTITLNFGNYDSLGGFSRTYEFIDTKVPTSMDALNKQDVNGTIDLNDVRQRVLGGQTIADAFIAVMNARDPQFSVSPDDENTLRATALAKGTYGNNDTLSLNEGQLSHYTLDYNSWFTNNGDKINGTLNEFLNGKGFRFYCATDKLQWYNVLFTDGDVSLTRPETGSSGTESRVMTILIDVSGLKDLSGSEVASRLVETIYNQGEPQMEAINHFLHFRANPEKGTLTVYDSRKTDVTAHPEKYRENLQSQGAKIADGVVDDVVPGIKYIFNNEKRLVIQDTDKDSQHIVLHIPQTSLNHIFRLDERYPDMSNYNVLTKSNRDFLLGYRIQGADTGSETANKNLGALDKGINYLLDAITLVGAQGARLEMTESNITTQLENETNSESIIRDADMAKEMTSYTKANVIAQASQAMLAQANQNSAAVLSLLR